MWHCNCSTWSFPYPAISMQAVVVTVKGVSTRQSESNTNTGIPWIPAISNKEHCASVPLCLCPSVPRCLLCPLQCLSPGSSSSVAYRYSGRNATTSPTMHHGTAVANHVHPVTIPPITMCFAIRKPISFRICKVEVTDPYTRIIPVSVIFSVAYVCLDHLSLL